MKNLIFRKIVALFLCGFVLTHVACSYGDDIDKLEERVDLIEGEKLTSIQEQMQSMQSSITSLESAKSTLENSVKALEQSTATILEQIAALQSATGDNADEIAALEQKVASIEEQIANLIEAGENLQSQINGINSTIETLATQDWVTSTLETLKSQYATAAALSEVNTLVETLQSTVSGLATRVDGTETEIDEIQKSIAEMQNTLKNVDSEISKAMDEVKAWVNEELKGYYTKGEVDGKIEAIEKTLEALTGTEGNVTSLADLKAALEQEVADRKAAIETLNKDITEAYEKAIEEAVKAQGTINESVAKQIKEVNDELDALNKSMEAITTRVQALEVDMSEVMNRIQSIVYVPENNDHVAEVVSLYYNGTMVSEGQVVMAFRVTPIDAAAQIEAAYEVNPAILSLEPEQVETRSAVQLFNISKVVMDTEKADGRFYVYANPNGLDEEFYTGNTSYSVALRLNKVYAGGEEKDYSGDVLSNYVNLVPVADELEGMVLVNEENEVLEPGDVVEYEIEYDDVTTVVELMKGYEVRYVYGGEKYTADELAEEFGYILDTPVLEAAHTAFDSSESAPYATLEESNFEIVDATEEACDESVKLKEADKNRLYDYLVTNHIYELVEGVDFNFDSKVTIIRPTRTATLEDADYTWTYQDFVEVYEVNEKADEYEGSAREFTLEVLSSDIPEDISGEDIVKYWGKDENPTYPIFDIKDEEGAAVAGMTITPVAYAEADGVKTYTIKVEGWEFDKSYSITAVSYYTSLDVKFVFNVAFEGLPESIEYTLDEVKLAYNVLNDVLVNAEEDSVELAGIIFEENGLDKYFTDVNEFAASFAYEKKVATAEYSVVRVVDEKELVNPNYNTYNFTTNVTGLTGYNCLWIANDGKFSTNYHIQRSAVLNEDDSFELETIFTPVYELPITINGVATIEMPKYAVMHDEYTVTSNGDYFFSEVKGLWDPNNLADSALEGFSTKNIDLNDTFRIGEMVNGEWKALSDATIAEQVLKLTYTTSYTDEAGIAIDANNILSYNGKADWIPVKGVLTVDGIEIKAAFTTVNDYSTYRVMKYDPIKIWSVTETDAIPTTSAQDVYTVSVWKNLQLTDKRDVELIDQNAENTNQPWVSGNGNNGFANGYTSGDVFGLEPIKITYRITDEKNIDVDYLDGRVIVDGANGTVSFLNLNNLALQKDIFVKVQVVVSYPWGEKDGEIVYTIQK